MATLEQCSRESICTAIRITPVAKKEQSFRLILCIAAAALGAPRARRFRYANARAQRFCLTKFAAENRR
jgi:hypothetical protein